MNGPTTCLCDKQTCAYPECDWGRRQLREFAESQKLLPQDIEQVLSDALKELLRRVIHYCDNVDVTGAYTDYEKAPECDLYSSGLYEKCKSILAAKGE